MLPVDAEPGLLIPASSFPSLNTVPEFVGKAALASIGDPFLRAALRRRRNGACARARALSRRTKTLRKPFLMTDPAKNQMLYINSAYETTWGRTFESLYASLQNWFEAIHPDAERRQLEMQLRQAQKMETIGQLAGGVAHDFNNLLAVILGHCEMLAMKLPSESPGRDSVDQIGRAAERAAALTRRLLAFSRQQVLEPQLLDLNLLVADMEKMLQRLIGENVRLITILQPDLNRVLADPGQIDQIIMNLAVNGRDAMPKGGRLTLQTRDLELDAKTESGQRPGRYVLLAVTDTGCGMTPEVQARIFEPFFTTKGVSQGTGLGLAMVSGMVQQNGGHIVVHSLPGIGTTFKIYLPAVGELAKQPLQSRAPVKQVRSSETILLVEDETSVREITALLLVRLGYQVKEASSGQEALHLAQGNREKIDLLMTDVLMPGMSGNELAAVLRASDAGLKVLFLSGHSGDTLGRHGVVHTEVAFLQKPFTLDALSRKLREVLDQR
jgi:two-component system cell cycle sensor histidine kinase/response regulator CckA